MEFDFEVQHRSGQKHIAVDVLYRLLTSQIDKSTIDGDIPAHDVDDVHAVIDFNVEKDVRTLKRESLLLAKKEDTNCLQLLKYADAPTVPSFTTNTAFF